MAKARTVSLLTRLGRTGALLAVVGSLVAAPPAQAASVANGGFEIGNFTGWTVENQPGGEGDWFVYSGTTAPDSGNTIPAPPEGSFAAISDTGGPGSHILYQDVTLEPGATHTLSFILYYENQAADHSTPDTLDYTVDPNQQYRVDIMNPAAPVTSVAPGDVLAAVFRTDPGEALTMAPTPMTFDLSPFAGSTVRIRFAEVDNQTFFNAGVDAVQIATTGTCQGKPVTIFGTNGDDTLSGTAGNDVIFAAAGDDTVKSKAGKDRVCGGAGNDTVKTGGGKDRAVGGAGNDDLRGGGGNDRLKGQAGNDDLNGGGGTDRCRGGPGQDKITNCE